MDAEASAHIQYTPSSNHKNMSSSATNRNAYVEDWDADAD